MKYRLSRRNFIKWGFLWGATAALAGCGLPPLDKEENEQKDEEKEHKEKINDKEKEEKDKKKESKDDYLLPRRTLGNTGEEVSALGLGGAIAVAEDPQKAADIVNRALDLGVNYIDTAAMYGDSESNIGKVMNKRRREAFLASKTDELNYDGTMRLLEKSLRQLQTDYLDLYQLHGIHDREMLEDALRDDGALAAIREMQEQGVVKYAGLTSHKNAEFLKEALDEYPFDCVLMSINAGDVYRDSMIEKALPVAVRKKMGIVAMKVASYDGRIFKEGGIESMEQALGYVLSHPVSTAIVGVSSVSELEENARIAREFKQFSEKKLKEIEELARPYEKDINFFKYRW